MSLRDLLLVESLRLGLDTTAHETVILRMSVLALSLRHSSSLVAHLLSGHRPTCSLLFLLPHCC